MNKNKLINRKQFIKKASLGIGSATLGLSVISGLGFATEKKENKLGVALVGLGNYATNQLAPALLETELCYLAGVVTGTKSKEEVWMKKYNIPKGNVYNYQNYDELKHNKNIDIIYVVLPNAMHAEYTIRAANAGKHVICEKPMAVSVKECQEMIDACKVNNVKLSIGYRLHFEPHHQRVMEIAKTKEFGAIRYVQSEFGFTIGNPNQWRLKKALAGGGALMDVGIYCIQGARMATGQEPIAVSAREFKTDHEKFKEVDETITWQLEFPDGPLANSSTSYHFNTNELTVSAESANYVIKPAYSYSGIKGILNNGPMDFPQVNQQAKQMDAFALHVKNNTRSKVSGEEGYKDLKIIEAIYKSIKNDSERIQIS